MHDYNSIPFKNRDIDKLKRSQKLRMKSDNTAYRGKVAVDEGREKKADRLLKKAARQENRSINVEDREKKKASNLKKKAMKQKSKYSKALDKGNLKKANRMEKKAVKNIKKYSDLKSK
tara:strand:+ start:1978 stop:2331 length:354 start_codon:yes stop_codon:yes gene_type:complete